MKILKNIKINKKFLLLVGQILIGSNVYSMGSQVVPVSNNLQYCPNNKYFDIINRFNINAPVTNNSINIIDKAIDREKLNQDKIKSFKKYSFNGKEVNQNNINREITIVNIDSYLKNKEIDIVGNLSKVLQENIDLDDIEGSTKSEPFIKAVDELISKIVNLDSNLKQEDIEKFLNKNLNKNSHIIGKNAVNIFSYFIEAIRNNLVKLKEDGDIQNIENITNIEFPVLKGDEIFIDSRINLYSQMKGCLESQIKNVDKILHYINKEKGQSIIKGFFDKEKNEFYVLIIEPNTCKVSITEVANKHFPQYDKYQDLGCDNFLSPDCKDYGLIKSILDKEKELTVNGDYYVFYHGQEITNYVYQALIKELIIQLGIKDIKDLENFTYLRMPSSYYSRIKNLDDFIKFAFVGFDWQSNIKKQLLSTNINLFNYAYQQGESTFRYFNINRSITDLNLSDKIISIFKYFRMENFTENELEFSKKRKNFEDKLNDLFKDWSSKGILLQIAIKKDYIPFIVYESYRAGLPSDTDIKIGATLNKECNEYVPEKYFDEYSDQARLLISNNVVLNPEVTKIFSYTGFNESQLVEINNLVTELVGAYINYIDEDAKMAHKLSIDSDYRNQNIEKICSNISVDVEVIRDTKISYSSDNFKKHKYLKWCITENKLSKNQLEQVAEKAIKLGKIKLLTLILDSGNLQSKELLNDIFKYLIAQLNLYPEYMESFKEELDFKNGRINLILYCFARLLKDNKLENIQNFELIDILTKILNIKKLSDLDQWVGGKVFIKFERRNLPKLFMANFLNKMVTDSEIAERNIKYLFEQLNSNNIDMGIVIEKLDILKGEDNFKNGKYEKEIRLLMENLFEQLKSGKIDFNTYIDFLNILSDKFDFQKDKLNSQIIVLMSEFLFEQLKTGKIDLESFARFCNILHGNFNVKEGSFIDKIASLSVGFSDFLFEQLQTEKINFRTYVKFSDTLPNKFNTKENNFGHQIIILIKKYSRGNVEERYYLDIFIRTLANEYFKNMSNEGFEVLADYVVLNRNDYNIVNRFKFLQKPDYLGENCGKVLIERYLKLHESTDYRLDRLVNFFRKEDYQTIFDGLMSRIKSEVNDDEVGEMFNALVREIITHREDLTDNYFDDIVKFLIARLKMSINTCNSDDINSNFLSDPYLSFVHRFISDDLFINSDIEEIVNISIEAIYARKSISLALDILDSIVESKKIILDQVLKDKILKSVDVILSGNYDEYWVQDQAERIRKYLSPKKYLPCTLI